MYVAIVLSGRGQWRWELHKAGKRMAESYETFSSYSLAYLNAVAMWEQMSNASISFDGSPRRSEPISLNDNGTRRHLTPMDTTFELMVDTFRVRGLAAALEVLNQQIAQRFSAVYRLEATNLFVNVAYHDKFLEPFPARLKAILFDESFCRYAAHDGQFQTSNSAEDPRLIDDPLKGVLNSYHSVPLVSSEGEILGTVCHFDYMPMALYEDNFELLRLAARVLVNGLSKTPPPQDVALT